MAGASDPLEDMLFNEVDEKAVSDLVGSLESQLGNQKTSAASYSEVKREGPSGAVSQFSGKLRDQVGSLDQPQQGHPKAGLDQEPSAKEALTNTILTSSTSSVATGGVINAGSNLVTLGTSPTISPVPGSATLSTQSAAASFNRATVLGPAGTAVVTTPNPNIITAANIRTASPGLQSLNGNTGAVKLVNSPAIPPPAGANAVLSTVSAGGSSIIVSVASQPNFSVPQSSVASPTITLQRHPSPVSSMSQNGVDPKLSPVITHGAASPAATSSQVMNHSNPLVHTKMLVTNQPVSGNSVILGGNPPPAVNATISQTQSVTSTAVTPTTGIKPAVNGVGQPAVTIVRPPGTSVMATSIQQQRPGLVTSSTRTAAPQLAMRPQQQTTIQLPPGFTIPPGMVLVRTETGQLVMVPQQVLAQAQAKSQQGQTVANISPRPGTPTAGATIRVSTPSSAPGAPQTVRLASPGQTRIVQSPSPSVSTAQAITMAPAGVAGSVKMSTPQKAQTVITAGGQALAKPAGVQTALTISGATPTPTATATPAARAPVVSQEMQENVKKCKNFLATLIKLASHNSPSPETSKNVKALVQDLLDAKIEPEEFTTRLQTELKSSPQPYLIPFLKKSLPALRQSLLNSQQSLMTQTPGTSAQTPVAPGAVTTTTIRARMPTSPAPGILRPTATLSNAATLSVRRPGVQPVQTRMPMVITQTQTIRPQGTVVRAPTIVAGKTPVSLATQANQRKLSDPGGGTFRDDDDINDVASMAGVNLNEENARILATSSELVGTKIRSCKDEAFLPTGLLHRRILDTAKKLGVTEVPLEVVNFISHATQSRLRSLLEKVSAVAQHRVDGGKDEELYEQSSDVRAQLRFFEQLERMEKQRKDEQEREILLKAAKSRARQEDPEQARLKQKAKEMQQQEQAQIRQRDANLTALAAIGPRKKRKLDSPGATTGGTEVASGSGAGSSTVTSSRQQLRQRITRVNLRDFIFCLEQERTTSRSLLLYKALLK
ncbi:transcription initiation factor TFIID subunit 4-like [Lampris incognitus]|uniref:transcription initiation factor TFIID subunit 4-like n=1 Tax=Lampris incognitus TaxID=2546036 RepID=UPI0024B51437|nr:transcription initiation factor TFIID subunit 4-like [Lampris incognitus]